jgi:predicted NAD-dependent protein-ADP-ribosyltransferase YbiA (DUF1768 family)
MNDDEFWGDAGDKGSRIRGKNHLGMNLMKVRANLRGQQLLELKMAQLAVDP